MTKTCTKGYTCGNGCISRSKTCRSNLGPDGQKLTETFAQFAKRAIAQSLALGPELEAAVKTANNKVNLTREEAEGVINAIKPFQRRLNAIKPLNVPSRPPGVPRSDIKPFDRNFNARLDRLKREADKVKDEAIRERLRLADEAFRAKLKADEAIAKAESLLIPDNPDAITPEQAAEILRQENERFNLDFLDDIERLGKSFGMDLDDEPPEA